MQEAWPLAQNAHLDILNNRVMALHSSLGNIFEAPRLAGGAPGGGMARHWRRKVLWVAILTCLLMVAARADFRVLERDNRNPSITVFISGKITTRDSTALETLSAELERNLLLVKLDSVGGDVDAAMKIGRLLRKYEAWTYIETEHHGDNANCYSSCALVFIAGVRRSILSSGGQLGLHRPYLASAPQSRQVLEKQVPLMLAQIKQYVMEMGITDNFYQQMVNTEPSQILVYGDPNAEFRELNRELGIRNVVNDWKRLVSEIDPLYQEIITSYDARRYGVTTLEMRKRDNDAEQLCSKRGVQDFRCGEALRWGLSERVYLERDKQGRTICWHDEDQKLLLSIPTRERRDHPVLINRETCIRNMMLGHTN
jgi:hypothetical protein